MAVRPNIPAVKELINHDYRGGGGRGGQLDSTLYSLYSHTATHLEEEEDKWDGREDKDRETKKHTGEDDERQIGGREGGRAKNRNTEKFAERRGQC